LKPIITDLTLRPLQPDRVWIYLNGRPWASVDLLTAAQFKVGDPIDDDTLDRLKVDHLRHDAYRCALRLLGRRNHSCLEIRQKLTSRGFAADAIGHALGRLKEKKYLDNQQFAIDWVNHRMNTAPRSRQLMAWELRQKGVGQEQIDEALAPVEEFTSAEACLLRKRRRWRRLAEPERRQKMLAYLGRKGFAYDVSRSAIASYRDSTD
jgi:regulatory protein